MSSKNIDERIVEMRFNNKQFESGVKETMGTLDRLKQALNLTSSRKSIENLDKAVQNVSFDQMSKSLSSIERRFSAMGIVGMRVIQNLTDSAMGQFGRVAAFVKESVVGGGVRRAMNIENAHFQLQALLKDEKKVQAVMDDAMDAVDGTAYGFDEAAKAASQFAASGLKAGKEMQMALKGITGVSAMTNREFSEIATIFTTVAGNGRLMGDQLLQFSDRGLNAASTLKDYFVEVKGLTGTTEQDIRDMVSHGEISFKTFAKAMGWAFGDSAKRANETFNGSLSNMKAALARIGAGFVSPLVEQNSQLILLFNAMKDRINDVKKTLVFDEAIGNTEALSKQFTDSVLAMAKVATDFLNNADLTKPLQMFYYGFESVKNVAKGALSVLKPVGSAFHDVFGLPTIDEISTVVEKVEELTSKLKLTSKQNDNLKTTFIGIFDIVKLVRDGVIKLLEAFIPVEKPISSTADQLLSLTATMGKGLSAFSKWVRQSPTIAKGYNIVSKAIDRSMDSLGKAIGGVDEFLDKAYNLPEVQNFLNGISRLFNVLGTVSAPYVDYLSRKIDNFRASAMNMLPETLNRALERFLKLIDMIGDALNDLNLSKPIDWITSLGKAMKNAFSVLETNYEGHTIKGLPFDAISKKIGQFKDTVKSFVTWFGENFGKVFDDMSFGGVVSGATGIGMVYSMVKFAKSLSRIAGSITGIPKVFDAIGDILISYQRGLDAKALKDIAIAIGIITGSLVVLSFANMDKVTAAAIQLGIISGIFIAAVDQLLKLVDKAKKIKNSKPTAKNIYDVLNNVGMSFSAGFKQFGKAAKWRMIAKSIRSFGETMLMLVGSIAVIQYLNKTDPEGFKTALKVVEDISVLMLGVMAVMTLIGSKFNKGMKGFSSAAKGMRSLSITMFVVTIALNRLMKMELPEDYKTKLTIFAGLFGGVAILGLALTKMANGGKKVKMSAGTMVGLAILLYSTVETLNRLFKMELPTDYKTKLSILAGIFAGMVFIIGSLGKASKNKSSIKATGTLLAFALDIAAIVGALLILSLIPGEKLYKGAIALGLTILALGKALSGVGKGDNSNYKSVLSMAAVVGSVVLALGVLSMIPAEQLLKSCTALGSMLLILALDLAAIGKSAGGINWKSIAALAAETVIIAASLYFLSDKPWEKLLAAAVAMGGVLLSVAGTMKLITSSGTPNVNQLTGFLLGIVAIIPIGIALNELAKNDWESLLASGAAIGMVLLAIGEMLNKVSSTPPPSNQALVALLAGAISIIPIAVVLNILAQNDWTSLLAASTSISEVLIALGVVLKVCSGLGVSVKGALIGIGLLDALIIDLAAIFAGLGKIFENKKYSEWLSGGAVVMKQLGNAIGGFVGGIVNGAINASTESLPDVGTRLSDFMTNLEPFFKGLGNVKEETIDKTSTLIQNLTNMCQSAQTLYEWLQSADLDTFGSQLDALAQAVVDFADNVSGIDEESLKGAEGAAKVLGALVTAIPSQGGLKGLIFGDQDLGDFGNQLKKLGEGLKNFVGETEGITEDTVKGASGAAKILADLGKSIPSNGKSFVSWLIGEKDLGDFGNQLILLGGGLRLFTVVTAGITEDSVTGAYNAIQMMIDLGEKLPNTDSFIGFFTGSNKQDFSSFGENLASFGESFAKFSDSLKEVNLAKINNAVESVDALIGLVSKIGELQETVPSLTVTSALGNIVFGDQDLDDFSDRLVTIGEGIGNFASTTSGISEESISSAMAAVSVLSSIANMDIPTSGSTAIKWLIGEKDLGEFGNQLVHLGSGLRLFTMITSGITEDSISGAKSAVQMMIDLGNSLPNTKSFVGYFTGSNKQNFKDFGENLVPFGSSLAKFTSKVADIKVDNMAGVKSVTEMMIDLADKMQNNNSFIGIFTGSNKKGLDTFGENLEAFAGSLVQFNDTLSGIDLSKIDDAVTQISKLVDLSNQISGSSAGSLSGFVSNLGDLGTSGIDNLTSSFSHGTSEVIDTASAMMDGIVKALKDKLEEFKKIGEDMAQKIINAINLKKESAQSAASDFADKIVSGLKDGLDNLYTIGKDGSEGLINGFRSHMSDARKAGEDIAKAMSNATKKKLDEHSPSRVMYKVGDYAGLGFINGFLRYISKAEQTGYEIGDSSVTGLNDAIQKVKTPYDQLFKNPVIQPVVDSSKVYAAASEIDKMFNRTVNLQAGRLSGFNSTTNRSDMRELLSAIKGLKNPENGQNYGNTYTIGNLTYTEGSDVGMAFKSLVRAIQLEGRA